MIAKEQGICLTCAHTSKCALTPTKHAAYGIQFCEEHETVHLAAAIPSNGRSSKRLVQRTRPAVLGLCGNCAHYPDCRFPKPESGVWHCEEYC